MDEEISTTPLTNNLKNVRNTTESSQFIDNLDAAGVISLENMPESFKNGILMNFVPGMSLRDSNTQGVAES